jgi:hypothetical protein
MHFQIVENMHSTSRDYWNHHEYNEKLRESGWLIGLFDIYVGI